MRRVGVLLTGCGALDGGDIHEAVFAAVALERRGARVLHLAPRGEQADVADHLTGNVREDSAPRGMMAEAARIARGRIEELRPESVSDLDALIVVGGMGAAKSLFVDALVAGRAARLRDEVAAPLAAMRERGAPLGGSGLGYLTLRALEPEWDFDPFAVAPAEAVADDARRLVWAPGFLVARTLDEAARGIEAMVEKLLALAASSGGRPEEPKR